MLAEATARMVEAARQCASHPHDTACQQHLRHTVEELRAATTLAATPALRKTLVTRLEVRSTVVYAIEVFHLRKPVLLL